MIYSQNLNVRTLDGALFRSLEEFLVNRGAQRQYYTLDPNQKTTIEGLRGTRIHFPARALADGHGQLVKNVVQVELIELFTPAEMVLANRHSTAEDQLLESGGQVAIFAYQAGKPLYLQQSIAVEVPVWRKPQNPLALSLFEQSISTMRTFSAASLSDWKRMEHQLIKTSKTKDGKYNLFTIDRFNWYQCSYQLPRPKLRKKGMVSVYPLGVRSLDDQLGFLIFSKINTVARMYWSGSHFTALNIPAQFSAEVVLLGLKNGRLFLGRNRFRKASDKTSRVHLHPCSQMDIIDALQDI